MKDGPIQIRFWQSETFWENDVGQIYSASWRHAVRILFWCWKKSCTWSRESTVIYRVSYISGGARRISEPSTVWPQQTPAAAARKRALYTASRCERLGLVKLGELSSAEICDPGRSSEEVIDPGEPQQKMGKWKLLKLLTWPMAKLCLLGKIKFKLLFPGSIG